MAKQLLAFVALLVLQGVVSSLAAPQSSGSSAFDEWFETFDPSTAVALRTISCVGKPNGFYPGDDPDTCSKSYTACVAGNAYSQTCSSGTVFDSDTGTCMDRYSSKSDACQVYPAPACSADNVGVFEPTGKCSDIYFICTSATAQPTIQICPAATPPNYFNPVSRVCESKESPPGTLVSACQVPLPPPTVPTYGCSDKEAGKAYATAACSVSFYTCAGPTATPNPGSCAAVPGAIAGTVFDYRADPVAPAPALCVDRSTVPECTTSLLATV